MISIAVEAGGKIRMDGGGISVISRRPSEDALRCFVEQQGERACLSARLVKEVSATRAGDRAGTVHSHLASAGSHGSPLQGEAAPHWCWVLYDAEVAGAKRLFRTGLGLSGPTNFVELPTDGTLFSYESYMMTALEAEDGSALVLYTTDHRRFLSKVNVYNRVHRHEFRNRRVTAAPVCLEAGFATEGTSIPGDGLVLPAVYAVEAPSVWDGARQAARHIAAANQARVPARAPRYFCSWYCKRAAFDESDLTRVIEAAEQTDAGFSTIQIDDGYMPCWGDWLASNEKWPSGMQAAAAAIRSSGHAAGIWVAPMTAEATGYICRDHPDWLLRSLDGEPIVKMKGDANAGYARHDRFALDLSHPGVRDHIRTVFTTLREWGFTAYKTDFMDWGYADSCEVRRHTPGKTGAMWFDEALRIIREAIGDDSYWLACISYFEPFVGYCDAMRVSSDVSESWNGADIKTNDGIAGGIMNVLQESFHDQVFNNILWANDPDCIFLRDHDLGLDDDEVESLALWSAILGGTVTVSDFFDRLPPRRLALWRFLRSLDGGERTARLPYWGDPEQPVYVAARTLPDGATAVLCLNPWDRAHTGRFPLCDLVGKASAGVASWTPEGTGEPHMSDHINVGLAPHHSRLFRVE